MKLGGHYSTPVPARKAGASIQPPRVRRLGQLLAFCSRPKFGTTRDTLSLCDTRKSLETLARAQAHPRRPGAVLLLLLACALIAPAAPAFYRQLTPEQVRVAYSIGRDHNRRDAFFAAYAHSPHPLQTGPDVQFVEFRTPYEQVALRARENQWSNYLATDAEKDYEGRPREVIVRFLIYETLTFDFPATEAHPDVGGFKFRISQASREIDYTKVTVDDAVPVGAGSLGSGGRGGLDIQLHFAASQLDPELPVIVEAIAPTGQSFSTTFNVAALK